MCVTPAGLTAEMFSAGVKQSKGNERECDNTGLFARSDPGRYTAALLGGWSRPTQGPSVWALLWERP